MSQWYYADAQRERHGPVEADVLRDKFRRNELDLGSLVWREGMSQWQPLSAMAEELLGRGAVDVVDPAQGQPPGEIVGLARHGHFRDGRRARAANEQIRPAVGLGHVAARPGAVAGQAG